MQKSTKKVLDNQKEKIHNYQAIFNGEIGRAVLWDLMEASGVLRPVFSKDPYEMAFNEGKRNLVLQILTYLDVDVKKFDEMINERNRYVRE